jgi:hypothetical protein
MSSIKSDLLISRINEKMNLGEMTRVLTLMIVEGNLSEEKKKAKILEFKEAGRVFHLLLV